MRLTNLLLPLALSLVAGTAALADVKLNPLFSDDAVFQRGKPINVWGTAEPGEIVVVRLGQKNVKVATTDNDGKWSVSLEPMEGGGPYELNVRGANRLIAHRVFVGEVWLCSGQSNMVLPTSFVRDSKTDIENSTNPDIHLFRVEDQLSATPMTTLSGSWKLAKPEVVRDFSGVAYYFAKTVQETLKVPVGIVHSAYAGTPIKVWMSQEAVEASHDTSQVNLPENFIAIREEFDKKVAQWQMDVADARAKGLEEPAKPVLPPDFYAVSSAFYGMINPLIPYSVRGVVWYQGESDTDYPFRWHKMFACMVDDWRMRWHDEKLPFVYVQLPAFAAKSEGPTESLWAELREGQLFARRIPFTYMTCTIDTAQGKFISMHPHEKKEIGKRLANVALAAVYKQPLPYSGPLYDSMEVVGNKIRLTFRFADGGLISKDGPVHGFEIAGTDKKFYTAQAQISGDSVLVWSDKVPVPVAVRYGWASNPNVNLFNKANLPAAPFRTDKWPHHYGKKKNV
jgi:sialate O-acetylesterase